MRGEQGLESLGFIESWECSVGFCAVVEQSEGMGCLGLLRLKGAMLEVEDVPLSRVGKSCLGSWFIVVRLGGLFSEG